MKDKKENNSFNNYHSGLNTSLLRALNANSRLQAIVSRNIQPIILPKTSFLLKKSELISNTIKPATIPRRCYQKSFLSMLKPPVNLKLINLTFKPSIRFTQNLYSDTITNTLNNFKYSKMSESIRISSEKFQRTFGNQKVMTTISKELFRGIAKDKIMSIAQQYRSVDFRIPNIAEKILNQTEILNSSEYTNIDNGSIEIVDPAPKELLDNNGDFNNKIDYPNVSTIAWVKTLFLYYKDKKDKSLDFKILVNGKLTKFSEFLHSSPQVVQNIVYISLLLIDTIVGPIGKLMALIEFLNWISSFIN